MPGRIHGNIARTALAVAVTVAALAPSAYALSKPTVNTGVARSVTFDSAVISGSVNPNGSETYYYVQYGPTRAYGAQSAITRLGAGTHTLAVSTAIGGLQPLTRYHYRLVAVNTA